MTILTSKTLGSLSTEPAYVDLALGPTAIDTFCFVPFDLPTLDIDMPA
jgi:hypothetical protein